ncbi:hypothetical protein E3P89_03067 [Wallemia ichthyophaga]|uniref:Tyrosinase copper-binding domain-containing protein n=1 Tax=Wallemia ichthyophaga TaxID=245174 RepID=A0A4V4LY48_WALIC|nr:hypothetical protein E3P91_03490 [Wallemia ichthyophaga]TIB08594.1 hypothetical protein E3P93_03453 [Wallemia ichthyophaga]TIB09871.1 hypothetical protein E3P90_03088 [Wallemia ichthyophaga]TIB20671.1 hypothetical protein E3P89_03067 [Wallemia ichthyophaga]TIB22298.1 hypothetical protein E3P88_03101 [Wallemia ichthyophaga]
MKSSVILAAAAAATFTSAFPTKQNRSSSHSTEDCPNGYAVRPEWSQMSKQHRKEYISALQCMMQKPSTVEETNVSSHYADINYTHQFPGQAIHFVAQFLPWHRHYVYTYHQELKECGYTGEMPFWAWDWNADDVFNSSVFDADPECGLGTNGTLAEEAPLNAFAVTNGGLANHTIEFPYNHVFQRNLQTLPKGAPQPLDRFIQPAEVEKALSFDVYEYFHRYVEGAPPQEPLKDIPGMEGEMGFAGMHGGIHRMIGGDMGGILAHIESPDWCPSFTATESSNDGANSSPQDPLFFLHHANVDRVWAQWQDQSLEDNMYAFGGWTYHNYTTESGVGKATLNDTMRFGYLTDPVPVHHAMDYRKAYCYVYADKDYREA